MQSVFVIITKLIASKNYFCKEVFVIILAAVAIRSPRLCQSFWTTPTSQGCDDSNEKGPPDVTNARHKSSTAAFSD